MHEQPGMQCSSVLIISCTLRGPATDRLAAVTEGQRQHILPFMVSGIKIAIRTS